MIIVGCMRSQNICSNHVSVLLSDNVRFLLKTEKSVSREGWDNKRIDLPQNFAQQMSERV